MKRKNFNPQPIEKVLVRFKGHMRSEVLQTILSTEPSLGQYTVLCSYDLKIFYNFWHWSKII